MNVKFLPGNGDFQTGVALIIATLLIQFIPELEPLRENLMEIIIVVLTALFTNAVRNRKL